MSNRPMHTSKRLIGLVSIACAAVVFSAAPAGAVIATPESREPGSYVFVGNKWKAQDNTICGETFSYVQRMTIDGVSTMVPTQFIYAPGRHALVLLQECDGYYIYALEHGTGDPV
jgi:hypothetical protein